MKFSITITTTGRRMDRRYAVIVVVAWLAIAILTTWGTLIACLDPSADMSALILGLPLGYIMVFLWPYSLIRTNTQSLVATDDALLILGTGIPFKNTMRIPKDRKITLYFGNDGGWGVLQILSLRWGKWSWNAVLLAILAHPAEKLKTLLEISSFLTTNGFKVEVIDEYSPIRSTRR